MRLWSDKNIFDLRQTLVVFRRLTTTSALFLSFTLTCFAQGTPTTVSVSFDFRNGAQGWQADFADYPPSTDNGFYELRSEMRTLPPELRVNGTGVDSVTLMREPFPTTSAQNFLSSDQRTRVILFGYNLELKNGEGLSAITAQAEDAQHRVYVLPVEAAEEVRNFNWIKAVTVKLSDELQGAGDVFVIGLRGVRSNQRHSRLNNLSDPG